MHIKETYREEVRQLSGDFDVACCLKPRLAALLFVETSSDKIEEKSVNKPG